MSVGGGGARSRTEERMPRKRPVLGLIGIAVLALACVGPASAASPQKIYKDLADNGRLDGKYSRADIARAFNLGRVVRTDERNAARVRRPAAPPAAGNT